MSKITQTLQTIQSGSRANKYRILYPVFGEDLDILCHSSSSPGRELGTVEVFLKGRKFQLAGEMVDDGVWDMTIYNTPDLLHRRFFLKMVAGVHNFNTPTYLFDNQELTTSDLNGGNSPTVSGEPASGGGFAGFVGNLSSAVDTINTAYNDIRNTFSAVNSTSDQLKQVINGDNTALQSLLSNNSYGKPWYMQDITIQQLDENENVSATTTLHNAFITTVGAVEYSDDSAEITTTQITFAYSGISYGNNSEIPSIENYK